MAKRQYFVQRSVRSLACLTIVLGTVACSPQHTSATEEASTVPLTYACGDDHQPSGETAQIVVKANALVALLGSVQRAAIEQPFTRANAVRWSNLPVPAVPRIGVRLGDMSDRQAAAVRDLVKAATSSCGLKMFDEIRIADDYIAPIIPMFGWTHENYYVAFLGKPSGDRPWMLKIGGHHLAYNFTFNGRMPGATPLFNGTEPIRFDWQGVVHEPLSRQSEAMSTLASSVAKYPEALLAGRFTDVVKGVEVTLYADRPPVGGNDTGFPSPYPTGATGRGVRYAELTPAQQSNVRHAIEAYAALPGRAISQPLVALYVRPEMLAQTYIGYANAPDLSLDGSYVRIDGPRVWMEFVVQPGVAYPAQLHYHALWRDKQADYGGEFSH